MFYQNDTTQGWICYWYYDNRNTIIIAVHCFQVSILKWGLLFCLQFDRISNNSFPRKEPSNLWIYTTDMFYNMSIKLNLVSLLYIQQEICFKQWHDIETFPSINTSIIYISVVPTCIPLTHPCINDVDKVIQVSTGC